MVLGTVETTPLEMAGVYSTFANQDVPPAEIITRVEQVSDEGEITLLYQRQMTEKRVMSEANADLVTHALRGHQRWYRRGGQHRQARRGQDRHRTGEPGLVVRRLVPRLTAVVWMGYPETGWDDPGTEKVESLLWPMNESGRPVQGRQPPAARSPPRSGRSSWRRPPST